MSELADIARSTVDRHDLLPPGCPVLVLVSGGGDSVALLRILAAGELGPHPLRVLHVNHLLRGDESSADEAFVEGLARELEVESRSVRYDVAAYAAAEKLNLEDAGRQTRYRFAHEELDAWCTELGVASSTGRIAVAHTRDDRVETFFMRAVAGAGAGGLNALAPRRDRIVRPLVDVDRSLLRGWLEQCGFAWREDASNLDNTRARALIRNELMPVVERLNPSVRVAIARTMELLGDDDALLTRMAQAFARDFTHVVPGQRVEFERDWMRTLEPTMARRTIRLALAEAFPRASRLESSHIEALATGLADDGFARDLPGGLRAMSEYGTMVILCIDVAEVRVAPSLLPLPGSVSLGEAGRLHSQPAQVTQRGGGDSVVIDGAAVVGELVVDSMREGDRIVPLGMTGSRKLSDVLSEAKIPRRERGAVPVVRDGDRVVWVAGVLMSDEYKVTEKTERAFLIQWERPPRDRSGMPKPHQGGDRCPA